MAMKQLKLRSQPQKRSKSSWLGVKKLLNKRAYFPLIERVEGYRLT
jgi:hypothetical protein